VPLSSVNPEALAMAHVVEEHFRDQRSFDMGP
jgi:hypothetical protein